MIPEIVDSNNIGLERLTQVFKGKEVIEGLLSSFLTSLNGVSSELEYLLTQRGIDNAYGDRLDQIGLIVGVKRSGKTDYEYRKVLRARLVINNGEATPNEMIDSLLILSGATYARYYEHYPASAILVCDGDVSKDSPSIMKTLTPAGVRGGIVFWDSFGDNNYPTDMLVAGGTHTPEYTDQWLPEYNDSPTLVSGVVEEGVMLIGPEQPPQTLLINSGGGVGNLLLNSGGGSYYTSQGILVESFEYKGDVV